MINETSVHILSKLILQDRHLSKIPTSFENNFEQINVNSIIEAKQFEPETAFERNIDKIKYDHVKIITSHEMNLLDITSNKPYLCFEHLNDYIMAWVVLQPPVKSIKCTKHLCLPWTSKETPSYKLENDGLLLDQNSIYPFFDQKFVNTSQQTSPDVQHKKHLKIQFNISKQKWFIHQQYQYKTTHLNESWKCIMSFITILWGGNLLPNANIQNNPWEMSARTYITYLWLCIIE